MSESFYSKFVFPYLCEFTMSGKSLSGFRQDGLQEINIEAISSSVCSKIHWTLLSGHCSQTVEFRLTRSALCVILLYLSTVQKRGWKKLQNQLNIQTFNSNKFYNGLVFYNISCSLDYTAILGISQTWYTYLRKQKYLPRSGK